MVNINWTIEAELWLKDIYDYISNDNPSAAKKVIDGIYEKVQLLRRYPEIGYKYQTGSKKNIRILLYGHYRIAYFVKEKKQIDILGIFHGSLEIDRYLIY